MRTEHEFFDIENIFIWNDKHEKIDQNEYKSYSDGSL